MEWFQNKTAQIIALVSIVGTLAGFGYTGATYVNRLENLENKIGGLGETEDAQQVIEERFASIETTVEYLEKQIDGIEVPDVSILKAQIEGISVAIEGIEKNIEKIEEENKNPLSG